MADIVQFALPPSPNWYCSAIGDCSLNGVYVFGARNCIYLLDVEKNPPCFVGHIIAHNERVTAVSWCKHKLHCSLVASGSEEKTVRVWDVETKLCVAEHDLHQAKITCLCWSPVATDLVVSGDEKGQVVAWKNGDNTIVGSLFIHENIFCVTASSFSDTEVAVGCRSGVILILSLESTGIQVIHKLRGHDGEVHSLAWCPVPSQMIHFADVLEKKVMGAGNCLLVSGSKDQTVRLWNTLQGKVVNIWHLPKRSAQKWRDRYEDQSRTRLWLAVSWSSSSANEIVASSHGGELVSWNLSKGSKESHCSFAPGHSRVVFTISTYGSNLITVSMDRQVIIWDQLSLKPSCTIPTLGGFVYSLAISPMDPGSIAIGVGDNMIRVWYATAAESPYEAVNLWQGIRAKVMVVRWHCDKEGLLGFGTEDGLVGIYNVLSKRAEMSSTYHKKAVYSISWGPTCPTKETTGGKSGTMRTLYSCGGDGAVLQHNPQQLLEDAIDVNALIKETNHIKHKLVSRTDIAWNSEGTVMALGNEDGSIEVFLPPKLKRVCTVNVHNKLITCLVWHHGYGDLINQDGTKYKHLLASGSNESTVHIHDLSKVFGYNDNNQQSSVAPVTESYRQLVGHTGRITSMSWSPHNSDLLISASYDGTAQVWNVAKGEPIINCRGHIGRVMSVVWSYLDPDVVFTGGEDFTVRPWRLSQQHHTQPPASDKKGSHSKSKSSGSKKKAKQKGKVKVSVENWRDETPTPTAERTSNTKSADSEQQLPNPPQTSLVINSDDLEQRSTGDFHDKIITPAEALSESGVSVSCEKPHEEAVSLSNEIPEVINNPQESLVSETDSYISALNFVGGDTLKGFKPASGRMSSLQNKQKGDSSGGKRKKKQKSMFPLSAVADNRSKSVTQEECVTLARQFYNKEKDGCSDEGPGEIKVGCEDLVNLGLFGDRRGAYRMVNSEGRHHAECDNLDYQLQLEIWKGNLGGALELASDNKQLSDWLVALSPLAGHDVWLNTVSTFADQLAAQGAHQRAVLYYLACHKVYQAIEVFEKQGMYREAIALAKVRLAPSDPVLSDLYCLWAQKLETDNSYEQAAKCYLGARLPAEAVRVLTRRGDATSLANALEVAVLCNEMELANSLALRLTQSFLLSCNWEDAFHILAKCSSVKAHVLVVHTHKLLVTELQSVIAVEDDEMISVSPSEGYTEQGDFTRNKGTIANIFDMFLDLTTATADCPWILHTPPREWFLMSLLRCWNCNASIMMDQGGITTAYKTLSEYYQSSYDGSGTLQQVLVRIAYEISLGFLSALMGKIKQASLYWLHPLTMCTKYCFLDLQMQLCCMLLPYGIESLKCLMDIARRLSDDEIPSDNDFLPRQVFRHFYAYYCFSLLIKLWWRCPEAYAIVTIASCQNDNVEVSTVPDPVDSHLTKGPRERDWPAVPENEEDKLLDKRAEEIKRYKQSQLDSTNPKDDQINGSYSLEGNEDKDKQHDRNVCYESDSKLQDTLAEWRNVAEASKHNQVFAIQQEVGTLVDSNSCQSGSFGVLDGQSFLSNDFSIIVIKGRSLDSLVLKLTSVLLCEQWALKRRLNEVRKLLALEESKKLLKEAVSDKLQRITKKKEKKRAAKTEISESASLGLESSSVGTEVETASVETILCEDKQVLESAFNESEPREDRRFMETPSSKTALCENKQVLERASSAIDSFEDRKFVEAASSKTILSEDRQVLESATRESEPREDRRFMETPLSKTGLCENKQVSEIASSAIDSFEDRKLVKAASSKSILSEDRQVLDTASSESEPREDGRVMETPSSKTSLCENRQVLETASSETDIFENRNVVKTASSKTGLLGDRQALEATGSLENRKVLKKASSKTGLFEERQVLETALTKTDHCKAIKVLETVHSKTSPSETRQTLDANSGVTGACEMDDVSYEKDGLQEFIKPTKCVEDETVEVLLTLENNLNEQLQYFHLQDLPFPDPVESALVISHFCMHRNDLPNEDDMQFIRLTDAVLRWSLRHAQTRSEIKRFQAYFSRVHHLDK